MGRPHLAVMTVDANVVIAYLAGEQPVIKALTELKQAGVPLLLSTIAETEILSFPQWTDKERHTTEQFLEENFTSVPFDRTVARIAAGIRRATRIKTPDAAIAATALFTHTLLLTRNVRDFRKVAGLETRQV